MGGLKVSHITSIGRAVTLTIHAFEDGLVAGNHGPGSGASVQTGGHPPFPPGIAEVPSGVGGLRLNSSFPRPSLRIRKDVTGKLTPRCYNALFHVRILAVYYVRQV